MSTSEVAVDVDASEVLLEQILQALCDVKEILTTEKMDGFHLNNRRNIWIKNSQ